MDSKRYVWIGGVIMASLFIFVVLLISLGGAGLFARKMEYKVYFSKSVKGLSIGAPVTFRGVRIGEVTNICLAKIYDKNKGNDESYPVEITFQIESSQLELDSESVEEEEELPQKASYIDEKFRKNSIIENWVTEMVENHGMVARLQTVSLLTGQLTISLETSENVTLRHRDKLNLTRHIIPSGASAIDKLRQALQKNNTIDLTQKTLEIVADFVNSGKAEEVLNNIHSISSRGDEVLAEMDKAMKCINGADGKSASLAEIVANLQSTLEEGNALLKQLKADEARLTSRLEKTLDRAPAIESRVEESLDGINAMTADVRKFLEEGGRIQQVMDDAHNILSSASRMLEEDSPERQRMENTLNELDRTMRSMRDLTDMLINKPEVLIRGK